MMTNRIRYFALALAAVAVVGCSATRQGKCHSCQSNQVYPTQPYYESPSYDSLSTPYQPAPAPAAEPLPLPSALDPNVPPPPPEALRARPIQQISDTTRGWYYSASTSVRAMFTR